MSSTMQSLKDAIRIKDYTTIRSSVGLILLDANCFGVSEERKERIYDKLGKLFVECVSSGDHYMFHAFKDAGFLFNYLTATYYQHAFNLASYRNNVHVMELLIEDGAHPLHENAVTEFGGFGTSRRMPIDWAIQGGANEAIDFLIRNGASIPSDPNCPRSAMVESCIKRGLWATFRRSVEYINVSGNRGEDVLYWINRCLPKLVMTGEIKDVQWAIDKGGNVNLVSSNFDGREYRLLCRAAQGGNLDTLQLLLKSGAKVHLKCSDLSNALHIAASLDHVPIVVFLLQEYPTLAEEANITGQTPFDVAVICGAVSVVDAFIEMDFAPEPTRIPSPADIAFDAGQKALHKRLVRLGYKSKYRIHIPKALRRIDLKMALAGRDRENLKSIIKECRKSPDTGLCSGPRYWPTHFLLKSLRILDLKSAQLLIDSGTEVNRSDHRGVTPLMIAAKVNSSLMVGYLLDRGANPNAADHNGFRALDSAISAAFKEDDTSAKLLVEGGANPFILNGFGESYLFKSVKEGNLLVVRYFLSLGIFDVLSSDNHKKLAAIAVELKRPDMLLALLDAGASPESHVDGMSSLSLAASYGDLEMVSALLRFGGNPYRKDCKGFIPYVVAKEKNYNRICSIMRIPP